MEKSNKTDDRQERIRQILIEEEHVRILDLCEEFGCSESTIRNDLKSLEEQGLCKRAAGIAFATDSTKLGVAMSARLKNNLQEKEAIARKIVEKYLHTGCSVFLDNGSTAVTIARHIARSDIQQIRVITASFGGAFALKACPNIELYLTGGKYIHHKDASVDKNTKDFLAQFNVDYYIMSCDGFDLKNGLSTSDTEEARIKSFAMERAKKTICALTSNKIGISHFARICDCGDVDVFIIDSKLDPTIAKEIIDAGINIDVAEL